MYKYTNAHTHTQDKCGQGKFQSREVGMNGIQVNIGKYKQIIKLKLGNTIQYIIPDQCINIM